MFSAPASMRRASSDNPSRLRMALGEGFNYTYREQSVRGLAFHTGASNGDAAKLTHWRSQCPLHQPRTQAKCRPGRKTQACGISVAHSTPGSTAAGRGRLMHWLRL